MAQSPQVILTDSGSRNLQAILAGSQAFGQGLGQLGQAIAAMRERQRRREEEGEAEELVKKYGAFASTPQPKMESTPQVEERQGFLMRLLSGPESVRAKAMAGQLISQMDPSLSQAPQQVDQKGAVTGALLKYIGSAMAAPTPEEGLNALRNVPPDIIGGASDYGQRLLTESTERLALKSAEAGSSEFIRLINEMGLPPEEGIANLEAMIAESRKSGGAPVEKIAAMNHALAQLKGRASEEDKSYNMLIGSISTAMAKSGFDAEGKSFSAQREIYEWVKSRPDLASALDTMSSAAASSDKKNAASTQFDHRLMMEISKLLTVKGAIAVSEETQAPILALFSKEITPQARKRFKMEMIKLHKDNWMFREQAEEPEAKK